MYKLNTLPKEQGQNSEAKERCLMKNWMLLHNIYHADFILYLLSDTCNSSKRIAKLQNNVSLNTL